MTIEELEAYLAPKYELEKLTAGNGQEYLVIKAISIPPGGALASKICDVAVLRSNENPWVPQAALQVRPPLVPMGQHNTQASPLGPEWQYWSRRFDKVPTPRAFLAHVLTILAAV